MPFECFVNPPCGYANPGKISSVKIVLRGCLKSLNCYSPGRLEVARQVQQEWLAAQRTGLAIRDFTHLRGLETLDFSLVHLRGLSFV